MTSRRDILKAGLAAGAATSFPLTLMSTAEAQALTQLQMFIPAAPGGGWDGTGRAIELVMRTDKIIENFKFEHAPGAGGVVGMPKFVGSKKGQPDAVMVGGMVMVGAIIANKAPIKMADVVPIARLTGEFEAIIVHPDSKFQTMKDLITAFKADPGSISWAGGSAGGTDHILAGMIAQAVKVDPKKVSYVAYAGGGPTTAALLGNQVSCGIGGYGEFSEQIKAGKLKAIAISADKRQPGINVPTLKEAMGPEGVDLELFNWRGVFGAPGITADQRAALVALFKKMAEGKTWQAECEKRDWTPYFLAGDDFGKFVGTEVTRITAILKDLGLAT